jgi:hypothetical protein
MATSARRIALVCMTPQSDTVARVERAPIDSQWRLSSPEPREVCDERFAQKT